MAAELPILQQMFRATVNARRLHASKLAPSGALCRTPVIFRSEKLIRAGVPPVCVPHPPATGILCYDYRFQTTQESVCFRSYFAQRTEAGQNQGNNRARRLC